MYQNNRNKKENVAISQYEHVFQAMMYIQGFVDISKTS